MRKIHEAKVKNIPEVTLWGSGKPKREFLYIDDLASAVLFLMDTYSEPETINVGTGLDISIKELAYLVKSVVKYDGKILFDTSYPDGTPRKLLDVTKIHSIGWNHSTLLLDGIQSMYIYFVSHVV